MIAVLAFLGALAGSLVGAVAGVYVERLRGRRALQLRIRDDVKATLFDINRSAKTIAWSIIERRIFEMSSENDLKTTVVDSVQDVMFHWFDAQLFLGDESTVRTCVHSLWGAVENWFENPKDEGLTQAVLSAEGRLSDALRAELRRL
jgi:hypothetical protein